MLALVAVLGPVPSTPVAVAVPSRPVVPPAASVVAEDPAAGTDLREGPRGAVIAGPPLVVWTRADGLRAPDPVGTGDGVAAAARLRALGPLTARVLAALDAVAPFPWRPAVRSLSVGCRPVRDLACPGGVVEAGDRLVVNPSAARWSDATLAYVLRHELAHVWQHATGDLAARRRDLDGVDLGPDAAPDLDPLEAAADCLAAAWGSPSRGSGYVDCPPAGVARMAAAFAVAPPAVPAAGPGDPQATPGSRPGRGSGTTPSSTARTAASVRPSTPSFR